MKLQHDQILAESRQRGLLIRDLSKLTGKLTLSISNDQREELFLEGTPLSLINLRALQYFDNKQLTKEVLAKLGIPYPGSIQFQHPDDPGVQAFLKAGQRYVCKPPDLTHGEGVEMNLFTIDEVADYWRRNQALGSRFMLEEQVQGADLRMQVVGGRIVAACTREPAYVTGDGKTTLSKLVENRRKVIKQQNPDNDLVLDEQSQRLLGPPT